MNKIKTWILVCVMIISIAMIAYGVHEYYDDIRQEKHNTTVEKLVVTQKEIIRLLESINDNIEQDTTIIKTFY